MTTLKTREQVKQEFFACGDTPHAWAVRNNFDPSLVYRVLSGYSRCTKGKGHEIAIALGMKPAPIANNNTTYPNFAHSGV
jgi:gp16 family phage-associated protein